MSSYDDDYQLPPKKTRKRGPRKSRMEERRAKVAMLMLAKPGISGMEIARMISDKGKPISYKTAERDMEWLRQQWRERQRDDIDKLMEADLARLAEMQSALWPQAVAADKQAIDRVLNIMAIRAEWLGYKAPDQLEINSTVTQRIQVIEVVRPVKATPLLEEIVDGEVVG